MYQLTFDPAVILRTTDNAFIPVAPGNSDYQAYLAWVAAGNTPAPIPLAQAKAQQLALLQTAYDAARQVPVSYMSTTFQADDYSQTTLNKTLACLTPAGATPAGFYWVDANNVPVTMTLAQLQGLAQAMFATGWAAFQHLQALKGAVNAATTVAQVQAVTW